jgi:hypothetical protein
MPPAKDTLTPPADKWKREQFIEEVIEVLDRHGGRAEKDVVIAEVYRRNRELFDTPYYQQPTGVHRTRWRHQVEWARNDAKDRGLIKPPAESGRGIWELTPRGHNWGGSDDRADN